MPKELHTWKSSQGLEMLLLNWMGGIMRATGLEMQCEIPGIWPWETILCKLIKEQELPSLSEETTHPTRAQIWISNQISNKPTPATRRYCDWGVLPDVPSRSRAQFKHRVIKTTSSSSLIFGVYSDACSEEKLSSSLAQATQNLSGRYFCGSSVVRQALNGLFWEFRFCILALCAD